MNDRGLHLIRRMKSQDHVPLLLDRKAWRDSLLRLRPVTASIKDARRLSRWRIAHADSFFKVIRPTPDEVLEWLQQYQNKDDDVLFIIETFDGAAWGQIGLYHIDVLNRSAELGRLIRGEDAPDGMMVHASAAVLEWAFDQLEMEEVVMEVFEDNLLAVALCRKLGFLRRDSYPVRQCSGNGMIIRWIPIEPGSNGFEGPRKMVYRMVLARNRFRALWSGTVPDIRKDWKIREVC